MNMFILMMNAAALLILFYGAAWYNEPAHPVSDRRPNPKKNANE
jgi:hypothetical protein